MATKGSAFRAEGNRALRTLCAHCGTSIPTEVGHAHPLDEALRRETWGLVGHTDGPPSVFPRVPLATTPDGDHLGSRD